MFSVNLSISFSFFNQRCPLCFFTRSSLKPSSSTSGGTKVKTPPQRLNPSLSRGHNCGENLRTVKTAKQLRQPIDGVPGSLGFMERGRWLRGASWTVQGDPGRCGQRGDSGPRECKAITTAWVLRYILIAIICEGWRVVR